MDACRVIVNGQAHTLDTALVNDRPMLLMATVGVHADAITGVDPARKRRWGVLAYVLEEIDRMTGDSRRSVTVRTREPMRVMVDGEAHGETPIQVRRVRRSLRLMVPSSAD